MRGAVLFERGEAAQQPRGHVRIGRYFAQRSLPRGIRHDGKRTSLSCVIGAENHAALRDFQARIDGAGDAAAVDVSRMWSDASDGVDAAGLDRSLAWRGEFPNFAQQIFGAAGIKPAGYGGSSYGGSHQ